MKIEEAPYGGATSSTLLILPPDNIHHTHSAEKPKDYRLGWLSWHTTNNKNLKLTGVRGLNFLVLSVWDKRDRKMIINLDQLTQGLNIAKPNARRLIDLLIAENLIVRLVQGSCKKGQGRICSEYGLGSGFDGEPPRMWGKEKLPSNTNEGRGVQRLPLGQEVTGSGNLNGQAVRGLPSPNSTLNTHTKELPLAFNRENWIKECLKLNQSRDLKDIDHTFEKARDEKGAKDSDWMRWAKHYDRYYEPTTKESPAPAPRSWQKQPIKLQESSCFSPRLKPLDHTNPKILEDSLYDALKNRDSTACIVAGLDPALVASAKERAEARLKPKTS